MVTVNLAWASPVSVLTYHNDNARTGRNTNETALTSANVNTNSFGLLFTYAVDGYVYAQPLILAGVAIPSNGVHNVVYVATEHDSVYAFDADSNAGSNAVPLWQVSFLNPSAGITSVPGGDVNCSDIVPEVGITSTPVIDPATSTIYIEAKTKEVVSNLTTYVHQLHALDAATGSEKFGGPVLIQASVAGTGEGNDGLGNVSLDALTQFTRTGLLLNNGVVYFGYAAHCDSHPYHGWLFGYDAATLATNGLLNTTPNGVSGGFWASGGGPASDANGNLYVATGNGTFDPPNGNYGDSLLRLSISNSLAVADYFTPHNQQDLFDNDSDLGSGGVLLLPDESGSVAHPHLAVCAGKEGTVYLVDRDNMGTFNAADDTQIVQSLPVAIGGGCFDTPAYFNNALYFVGAGDVIKALTVTDGSIVSTPSSQGSTAFSFPGATVSVSANGTNDAIAWIIQSDAYPNSGPSILHAYNAADVSQELYNSSQAGARDTPGGAVKFTVPTIANGKVYVGTATGLSVFGNMAGAPTIVPNGGVFTNSVLVTLADAAPGAVIYYTLDNTTPTTNSALYTGPFSQTTSATISAQAFLGGLIGSTTVSANFSIGSLQPPAANFAALPTTGLAPLTVTFTDTSTGTITNRFWMFGDSGTTNTLNTTVAYSYNSPGTNTVSLVVTGPLGVSTNTLAAYVIVTNLSPLQVVSPVNPDFGLLLAGAINTQSFSIVNAGFPTLTGTATVSGAPFALVGGSPYSIDAGQTGVVSVSFSPLGAGAFTGSLVFASNGGVSTNAVTGLAAAATTADFAANPTNGTAPLLVNFIDVSVGSVTSRSWTFGDGNTSGDINPSHTYPNAGIFSVALTVSGPGGSSMTNFTNLITVTNVVSTLPTVTILCPGNGMLYPPVTNLAITIVTSATANDGATISNIEFFVDSNKLGETTSNPGTNFLFNPTFGSHAITARATDTLGATHTSTAVTIIVGAKNSPVGNWEVTVSGADKGVQFLTIKDDFSASGFGIRLKQFGLENLWGHWGFNTKGQLTGEFLGETGNVTNWTGTLLGPAQSLRSVNGTLLTTASSVFHWRGIVATTSRDLSGTWIGSVTVAGTPASPVSYVLSPSANDSTVFDIATTADPSTVVGQLVVTSRNRVYGYITFGGKPITMFGLFNVGRLGMSLNGTDNRGERVKIKIVR
jgi:PKD repeat protein